MYLGVDIGTFESKGVIVDGAGRVLAQASRPHRMLVPQPGWAEHRADEDWWGDFTFIVRALLASTRIDPKAIRAIATSAIGPCLLPLDAAGRPLTNGILYGVDTRASAEIAEMNATIGEAAILARSHNALSSQAVGPKILWLARNRPDVWARTAKLVTSTTYLTFRLTGRHVIDHYTASNFAPLYDMATGDWNLDLAPICRRDQLPEILWTTGIAGPVTAAAAAETGLAEGTPVTCGTIDAAAEAVSVGVTRPGEMMLMYGSTIFVIQIAAGPVSDPRLWHAPWLFPGQRAAMAGLATSGTLTHWLRDTFGRDLAPDTAFATLTEEAMASPKGAKGLICLPYFSGERTPLNDPLAKGCFFGLNLTHTRGDLYRAALEGIAAATRHIIDTYAEAGSPPSRVLAVGGGTKNAPWLQATSDFAGVEQQVCRVTTGASYGDCWLAAQALGDPVRIEDWNPVDQVVRPERVPAYDRQYPLFLKLYEATKDIAHAL